jgi:hypothetical protein
MPRRWSDARGQTVTEYLMILGVMTSLIAVITSMVVPTVAYVMVKLVNHLYIYLS